MTQAPYQHQLNGVDVDRMRETLDKVREDPSLANTLSEPVKVVINIEKMP